MGHPGFRSDLVGKFRGGEGKRIIGKASQAQPVQSEPAQSTERLQQRILMCAKQSGGIVMPTDVTIRTGCDLDAAKNQLESLVDKGYAEIQSRKDGVLVYVFPNMITDEARSDLEPL